MAVSLTRQSTFISSAFLTTTTITLSGTPASGSQLIYVHWSASYTDSVTGISGCGATWAKVDALATSSTGGRTEFWIATGCNGTGNTVSVTGNTAIAFVSNISEWTGLSGTFGTPAHNTSNSASSAASGAVLAASVGDLVVSVLGDQGSVSISSVTDTGQTFTALTTASTSGYRVSPAYAVATQTTTASQRQWNFATPGLYSAISASLVQSGSGGTTQNGAVAMSNATSALSVAGVVTKPATVSMTAATTSLAVTGSVTSANSVSMTRATASLTVAATQTRAAAVAMSNTTATLQATATVTTTVSHHGGVTFTSDSTLAAAPQRTWQATVVFTATSNEANASTITYTDSVVMGATSNFYPDHTAGTQNASVTFTANSALRSYVRGTVGVTMTADSSFSAVGALQTYYTLDEGAGIAISSHASITVEVPLFDPQTEHKILVRLQPHKVLTMQTPAIIGGKPILPAHWIQGSSTLPAVQGVMTPDPPYVPPAPKSGGGVGGGGYDGYYRWLASDLASDEGWINTWPEHDRSGPSWHSVYPYRPLLVNRVHYTRNGEDFVLYKKAALFHPNVVEHMWLDMGKSIPQPFTWVFAGVIHSYPYRKFGHYMLDAGKRPPSTSYNFYNENTFNEGLSYRSLMLWERRSGLLCSRPVVEDGVYVRTEHTESARPRVWAGEFNGAHSYLMVEGKNYFRHHSGKIDVKSNRYFITGRRQNKVSRRLASHMSIFEIRFFDRALTAAELQAQYRQLASTYKINTVG